MTVIAMGLGLGLHAQSIELSSEIATTDLNVKGKKILTMEEAVLGRNLSVENKAYNWRPKTQQVTYVENKTLFGITPKGKKADKIISLDQVNSIIGKELSIFPRHRWLDENILQVTYKNTFYKLNIADNKIEYKFSIPSNSNNFTPSSDNLFAYTKKNNLYYCDNTGKQIEITNNKDKNIVSGQSVSRNEFGIMGGIFWSNKSKKLAFYQKDETKVTSFPLLNINTRTGSLEEIKYPMAGMDSEVVELGIYDITSGETIFVNANEFEKDRYLTNITWSPCDKYIYIQILNRNQKEMKLNQYLADTGEFIKTILEEKNEKYVEPSNQLVFMESDNSKFLYRTNNRDGFANLYICSTDGTVERITKVDADVAYVGQDKNSIYYSSAEVSPIENHLFKQNIKSGKREQLTKQTGWHYFTLSSDGKYFIDNYSNITTPRVISITATNSKLSKKLFTAKNPVSGYNYGKITLGKIKSADGKHDNYYRLTTPPDFDTNKKYPTILYVYGGPHSQLVKNTWLGEIGRWEMYMAQKGYIVYVQDNRGTTNRGSEFEKAIHGICGQEEMADQMEGVKMLQSLSYVDSERIGVHGWSYGGFMTISLMTTYPEIFKVGVAGGPVIDWKWYEAMYGERYMDTPESNPKGYALTSLIDKASKLDGKLLICQGAIDDVVLWQHSLSFIRACVTAQKQVDYFPYPRAKHNVIGKDRIHLMDKVTLYFEDFLR